MSNSWNEHQKLVIDKLNSHAEKLDKQSVLITDLRLSVMQLKTRFNMRSTFFGASAGSLAGFLSAFLLSLVRGLF